MSRNDKLLAMLGFAVVMLISYISIKGMYYNISQTIVPLGDPYSYTVGHYAYLDSLHSHSYIVGFGSVLSSWYLLTHILITLLSPILVKTMVSLCFINYFLYFFVSVSLFRLAYYLGAKRNLAFLCGLLPWCIPIMYTFSNYLSLPVLALDSAFLGILYIAIANTLVYLCKPSSMKNAVIAGIATGVACWGRGNSFLAVSTISCIPVLYNIYILVQSKWDKVLLRSFLSYVLLASTLGISYYVKFWEVIIGYYRPIGHQLAGYPWTWKAALSNFNNLPGMFFYYQLDVIPTAIISLVVNIFLLYCIYYVIKKRQLLPYQGKLLTLTAGAGAFIYFFTYAIMVGYFCRMQGADLALTAYVVNLSPMLVGMMLILISYAVTVCSLYQVRIKSYIVLGAVIVLLSYTHVLSKARVPVADLTVPNPTEVKLVAAKISDIADGKPINFLWYETYNLPILNYYNEEENSPTLNIYGSDDNRRLTAWVDYLHPDQDTIDDVKGFLTNSLTNAAVTVVPANIASYKKRYEEGCADSQCYYTVYHFGDFIANFYQQHKQDYVIRMVVWDTPNDPLLVIQQKQLAAGQGVPMPANYGSITVAQAMQLKTVQVKSGS